MDEEGHHTEAAEKEQDVVDNEKGECRHDIATGLHDDEVPAELAQPDAALPAVVRGAHEADGLRRGDAFHEGEVALVEGDLGAADLRGLCFILQQDSDAVLLFQIAQQRLQAGHADADAADAEQAAVVADYAVVEEDGPLVLLDGIRVELDIAVQPRLDEGRIPGVVLVGGVVGIVRVDHLVQALVGEIAVGRVGDEIGRVDAGSEHKSLEEARDHRHAGIQAGLPGVVEHGFLDEVVFRHGLGGGDLRGEKVAYVGVDVRRDQACLVLIVGVYDLRKGIDGDRRRCDKAEEDGQKGESDDFVARRRCQLVHDP